MADRRLGCSCEIKSDLDLIELHGVRDFLY